MFKKFTREESVSGHSQCKSSVQRAVKRRIVDSYPQLEDNLNEIFAKKKPLYLTKCHGHITLVESEGTIWFFNIRDGQYLPTLRTLHKFPGILPSVGVDRGAIKYVLAGAHIMCPGLTSEGGDIEAKIPENTFVAITAEGKKHPLAIGLTKMSTKDMKSINKGVAVESVCYLNDGLWTSTKNEVKTKEEEEESEEESSEDSDSDSD